MICFFDSSGLIKRYVAEQGSAWVEQLADPQTGNQLYVAGITLVEMISAVTRRQRNGTISASDAASISQDIYDDFAQEYQVVEITALLLAQAARLAQQHALRGYDAVQLAAALAVNARAIVAGLLGFQLISADIALNAVATLEGLLVEDPNTH